MHRLALLLGLILWVGTAAGRVTAAEPAPTPAPTAVGDLQPGELRLDCTAGYGYAGYDAYALPIANAELARQWTAPQRTGATRVWATRGTLAYQLAYDYSVVPVHVFIEHRKATAFSGSVEIISQHGYAAAESPDGSPTTIVRRSFDAPPSVPVEFTLAPRFAPPSQPGEPVHLQINIYQRGITAPIYSREHTVIQLEPAHLYSLLLDGEPGAAPLGDELNADNRLGLSIPPSHGTALDPAIYSSMHYLLTCPRGAVTGQPLAARQFAFVLADFAAVAQWSPREQTALAAYVMGGGRLCLFDAPAGAQWQGLTLSAAQSVGRGKLLPVTGVLTSARSAVKQWLEGELTEFTLLAGGTAGGHTLPPGTYSSLRISDLELRQVYGVPDPDKDPAASALPLARRAGFLHPLWLYREACDGGAVEPWDYPEFTRYPVDPGQANVNLRRITGRPPFVHPPPALATFATSLRRLPDWWLPAAALVGLLPLLGAGLPRLRRPLRLGLAGSALLLAALGAGAWSSTRPLPRPLVSEALYDADASCPVVCARQVAGRFGLPGAETSIPLPPDALLRRVDWQPAGPWDWDSSADATGSADGPGAWHGRSATSFAALRSDSVLTTAPTWPVTVRITRRMPQFVELEITSSALPPGSTLLLQTALGWQALRASAKPQYVSLSVPELPIAPGWERLEAVAKVYLGWKLEQTQSQTSNGRQLSQNSLVTEQRDSLLTQLLSGVWPSGLKLRSTDRTSRDEQERLGWSALLQDPLWGRGLPTSGGVLYIALPTNPASALPAAGTTPGAQAAPVATDSAAQQSWLRYTFPFTAPAVSQPPMSATGEGTR